MQGWLQRCAFLYFVTWAILALPACGTELDVESDADTSDASPTHLGMQAGPVAMFGAVLLASLPLGVCLALHCLCSRPLRISRAERSTYSRMHPELHGDQSSDLVWINGSRGSDGPTSPEALLECLLALSDADAEWVLHCALTERPQLRRSPSIYTHFLSEVEHLPFRPDRGQNGEATRKDIVRAASSTGIPGQGGDAAGGSASSETTPRLHAMKRHESDLTELPVLQFLTPIWYCVEDDQYIDLDVVRIGNRERPSEVQFKSQDWTAVAGKRYHSTSGTLVFEPGDTTKSIRIALISSNEWDTTLEFSVILSRDHLVGATLPENLSVAKVRVIDRDLFPTNKYADEIKKCQLNKVPPGMLFIEYCKRNWGDPVVRRGTIKRMLADQVHNFYFIFTAILNIYLIDAVLKASYKHHRSHMMILVQDKTTALALTAILFVIPLAALHVLDSRRLHWRVGGSSRILLQRSLIRKFLNYTQCSRSQTKEGDLVMAMTRDSVDIVQKGYYGVLALAKELGHLLILLAYDFLVAMIFHKPLRPSLLCPFAVLPVVLISFLVFRRKLISERHETEMQCQNEFVDRIDQTVMNYQLIADYDRRNQYVDLCENAIRAFNRAHRANSYAVLNNRYFARWLSVLTVAIYIFFGGSQVVERELVLGVFLMDLRILQSLGKSWTRIYEVVLELQSVFPALDRLVTFMNLETDLKQRMTLVRARLSATKLERDVFLKNSHDKGVAALDLLPIEIQNIDFSYEKFGCGTGFSALSHQCALEIPQGTLTALVGRRWEGKTTLLKVIAGSLLPNARGHRDGVHMPSHLRVLHVSSEALFFHGTLLENLTFGLNEGHRDANPERVMKICRRLCLPHIVLEHLQAEVPKKLAWKEVLSQAQRHLLCLARALTVNPTVMCCHKPTLAFDDETSRIVLQLLRKFVDERGVVQSDDQRGRRRPRTCIITSSREYGVEIADRVLMVTTGSVKDVSLIRKAIRKESFG